MCTRKRLLEPTQVMAATNRPSTATTIAPTNENPLVKTDKVTGETLLAVFEPPHAFKSVHGR